MASATYTKKDVELMLESVNRTLELNNYPTRYKIEIWGNERVAVCQLIDLKTDREISPTVEMSDMHDILSSIQNVIYYSLGKGE